jgi:formylglycine-generating enzyme required for sulfatase activity
MHGNVAEWCADLYVPKNKTEIPAERIIKGGSWASPPEHSRAGASFTTAQNASTWALGFRVILARKSL